MILLLLNQCSKSTKLLKDVMKPIGRNILAQNLVDLER